MKAAKTVRVYALLLIMAITFSNCKKAEPMQGLAAKPIVNYVVKFKFEYTNPQATDVHNCITIFNNADQYIFVDVSNGYEFSLNAKTDDMVTIVGTNSSTPGFCTAIATIFTNGVLWKTQYGNNNSTSGSATANATGVLQ